MGFLALADVERELPSVEHGLFLGFLLYFKAKDSSTVPLSLGDVSHDYRDIPLDLNVIMSFVR